MNQRNDQVFQLSLTEIAFTIAFILLLLLGYLVVKEQTERKAAEAALSSVQSSDQATAALDVARSALRATMHEADVSSPDEIISKLIAVDVVRSERDRWKKRADDLDEKLTTLEELQKQLEKAALVSRPDITRNEISSALVFQKQAREAFEEAESFSVSETHKNAIKSAGKSSQAARVDNVKAAEPTTDQLRAEAVETKTVLQGTTSVTRAERSERTLEQIKQAIKTTAELKKQLKIELNQDLSLGQERQTVREVVSAAKSYGEMVKAGTANPVQVKEENSDLRGQVAFLKNRLDARGGRDFPPCWADETGKVEFLFLVEVTPDSVVVTPAWPTRRETVARALPGIAEILAGPQSNQTFVNRIQGVFNWSKSQDPECRHYVQLKSSISEAVQSDRARLMVESFFYKTEIRR